MFKLRKSKDRGHFNHGWLETYHTFSFSEYHDPAHMAFRSLRVINEDFVAPSKGFPTHGHKNMEIVTVILEGALEHKDSMGTGSVIRPGDVQRMSAGSGVQHSEFNGSPKEAVHLLQIWIIPEKIGGDPSYEQKHFEKESRLNQLKLIGSPNGENGSIHIHQDVKLYASILESGKTLTYTIVPRRGAWIQIAKGSLTLSEGDNKIILEAGDGASIENTANLAMIANQNSEFILFDLA